MNAKNRQLSDLYVVLKYVNRLRSENRCRRFWISTFFGRKEGRKKGVGAIAEMLVTQLLSEGYGFDPAVVAPFSTGRIGVSIM